MDGWMDAKAQQAQKDMKQTDKLMAITLGIAFQHSHPLPLPASAAPGFRQTCRARRFSVGACGKVSKRSEAEL